jgi:hypothetical protein
MRLSTGLFSAKQLRARGAGGVGGLAGRGAVFSTHA